MKDHIHAVVVECPYPAYDRLDVCTFQNVLCPVCDVELGRGHNRPIITSGCNEEDSAAVFYSDVEVSFEHSRMPRRERDKTIQPHPIERSGTPQRKCGLIQDLSAIRPPRRNFLMKHASDIREGLGGQACLTPETLAVPPLR